MLKKAKKVALKVIEIPTFQTITRRMYNDKFIVLMYHGVCEDGTCDHDWLQVQESDFREQMEHLSENYDVISLQEAISGRKTIKKHTGPNIVITFDDGYENNYRYAFPILQCYALPATIFLVSNYINTNKMFWYDRLYATISSHMKMEQVEEMLATLKKYHPNEIDKMVDDYLDSVNLEVPKEAWECYHNLNLLQIKIMADSGLITFGSHTANHELLTNMDYDEVYDTLESSFNMLEEQVPGFIPVICYPNGWYNDDIIRASKEIGYIAGIRADNNGGGIWIPTPLDYSFLQIPRWGIGRNNSIEKFSTIVSGSLQLLRSLSYNS